MWRTSVLAFFQLFADCKPSTTASNFELLLSSIADDKSLWLVTNFPGREVVVSCFSISWPDHWLPKLACCCTHQGNFSTNFCSWLHDYEWPRPVIAIFKGNIVITVTGSRGESNFDRLCSGSMDAGWRWLQMEARGWVGADTLSLVKTKTITLQAKFIRSKHQRNQRFFLWFVLRTEVPWQRLHHPEKLSWWCLWYWLSDWSPPFSHHNLL